MKKDYIETKQGMYKSIELLKNYYMSKILKHIDTLPGMRVLDIGCGYGYLLKLFDELGFETYGIDISEDAIKKARKITKAKVFVYDVNNGLSIFSDEFFDLITLFDVIEHLYSPYNVLKETHRILKKGGKIFITTPNLNSIVRLIKKFLKKEELWYAYTDPTHVYLFTPSSLRFLVRRIGFKIVELETPFYLLPKSLQKIFNKSGLGGQIWLVASKE